jgi:tetratricopeptide (TPR) repeat protein
LAALPYDIPVERPFVCLDLETTGLATGAGTLAFLVGLGVWDGDRFTVRQLLLPDHADERGLLDLLAAAVPADACLVTYNGRSFDWPLIVARYRMHGRDAPAIARHLDLLPIARGLWKHRLGTARLAIVEQAICAVERKTDLPGAFIPDRYFAYLRSRRSELLRDILEHNQRDIVSLGLLLAKLAAIGSRTDWERSHPGDMLGLGRAHSRRGRHDAALECVDFALRSSAWVVRTPGTAVVHRELSAQRAQLLGRLGRRDDALAAWTEIAARGGPGAAAAWLHLARHREHRMRDIAAALDACREAAAVAGRARAWGEPMVAVERDLERRVPRLRRKAFGGRFERRVRPAA